MGYDQYTVPDDCSCRTYFCCFPLTLANTFPTPFVPILSNFFEKKRELKTTDNAFQDCRVHFSRQPFSSNKQVFFSLEFVNTLLQMEAKAVKNASSLLQFSGHSELENGLFALGEMMLELKELIKNSVFYKFSASYLKSSDCNSRRNVEIFWNETSATSRLIGKSRFRF